MQSDLGNRGLEKASAAKPHSRQRCHRPALLPNCSGLIISFVFEFLGRYGWYKRAATATGDATFLSLLQQMPRTNLSTVWPTTLIGLGTSRRRHDIKLQKPIAVVNLLEKISSGRARPICPTDACLPYGQLKSTSPNKNCQAQLLVLYYHLTPIQANTKYELLKLLIILWTGSYDLRILALSQVTPINCQANRLAYKFAASSVHSITHRANRPVPYTWKAVKWMGPGWANCLGHIHI